MPDPFVVKAPSGAKRTAFKAVGITLERPRNWKLRRRDAPGVFELLSGEAVVAGWAYPREEDLPETAEQLEAAEKRLIDAARERDPGFRLSGSEIAEVAGAPSIEVSGTQVISKRRLGTRSVHVFEGELEYVFEALAPPGKFRRANRVLEALLDSVELTGKVAEERR